MGFKLIHQAYGELAYLRLCLNGAERHRMNTGDLRRRIEWCEARIRTLEWATFSTSRS
jgi:hypothetical protein